MLDSSKLKETILSKLEQNMGANFKRQPENQLFIQSLAEAIAKDVSDYVLGLKVITTVTGGSSSGAHDGIITEG